jgi:hypothetical protein
MPRHRSTHPIQHPFRTTSTTRAERERAVTLPIGRRLWWRRFSWSKPIYQGLHHLVSPTGSLLLPVGKGQCPHQPKSSPILLRSSDSDVTTEPRFNAETVVAKSAVVRLAQSGYRSGRTLLVVVVTGATPACR